EAECLRGLEIDDQLVLGGRLHRQVGRLLALEDAIDVAGCGAQRTNGFSPIGDETTSTDVISEGINRWQLVAGGQPGNDTRIVCPKRTRCHHQTAVRATRKFTTSCRSITFNSIPIGPTAWIAANWPIPAARVESRRTAARVTLGAISLSISSHFAPIAYSKDANPVMLPPGRARLLTKPARTGSITPANTIGTVRIACCNAATAGLVSATMMSGASATN